MHLLRAPLPQLDVRVAPVGRLEGRLAGSFARENTYLIAVFVSRGRNFSAPSRQ